MLPLRRLNDIASFFLNALPPEIPMDWHAHVLGGSALNRTPRPIAGDHSPLIPNDRAKRRSGRPHLPLLQMILPALLALAGITRSSHGQCPESWDLAPGNPGINGVVYCAAEFAGQLYIGG